MPSLLVVVAVFLAALLSMVAGVTLRYRFRAQPHLITVDRSSDYEPMFTLPCRPEGSDFVESAFRDCVGFFPPGQADEDCKRVDGNDATSVYNPSTTCTFRHGDDTYEFPLPELEDVFAPGTWRAHSAAALRDANDQLYTESETYCRLFYAYDPYEEHSTTYNMPRHCWGAGLGSNTWRPQGLDNNGQDSFEFDAKPGCQLGRGYAMLSEVNRSEVCAGRVGDTDPLIISGFELDTTIPEAAQLDSLVIDMARGNTLMQPNYIGTPFEAGVYTLDLELFRFSEWKPCKAYYTGDASVAKTGNVGSEKLTDFGRTGRCCVFRTLESDTAPYMFCRHGTIDAFRPITALGSDELHNVFTSTTDSLMRVVNGTDLRDTVPLSSANVQAYSTIAPAAWPHIGGRIRVDVQLPSDVPSNANVSDHWAGVAGTPTDNPNQPLMDAIREQDIGVWLRAGRRGRTSLFETNDTFGASKMLTLMSVDYMRLEGEATVSVSLAPSNAFGPASTAAVFASAVPYLTVSGTFVRGPEYTCRWVFREANASSVAEVLVPAEFVSDTNQNQLQCTIPSNQGKTGSVFTTLLARPTNTPATVASACPEACLADSAVTLSECSVCREMVGASMPQSDADFHQLDYTVTCPTDCNAPSTCTGSPDTCNRCDERIGECQCADFFVRSDCTACADVVAENQCSSCLGGFSSCGWCAKTLRCGPCEDGDDAFFLTGEAVDECPSVQTLENIGADPGDRAVRLGGGPFFSDLEYMCNFGSFSTATAIVQSRSELDCPLPDYRELEPLPLTLRIVYNGALYVPAQDYALTYTPPVEETNPVPIVGGVVGTIVGAAIVVSAGLLVWQRRRKIAADRFRSLFLPPKFELDTAFTEFYHLSFTERNEIEKKSSEFWYLEELLFGDTFYFLEAIADTFETHESDDISRALVYLAETQGKALEVLPHFIRRQVRAAPDGANIFRGYNPASKMWTGYSRMQFGQTYAHRTLHLVLYRACTSYAEQDLEINPERITRDSSPEDQARLTENSYILLSVAQRIFDSIVESIEYIPEQFLVIATAVYKAVEDRFPGEGQRSVASFFFLRFWAPAISAPEAFGGGLLKVSPSESARRLLVLTAKVLMNLANHVLFTAKNEALQNLNDFIESNVTTLSQWCDEISNADDDLPDEIPTESVPPEIRLVSLALVHQYIINHLERIRDQLEATIPKEEVSAFETIREALNTTIEQLGEPLDLIPPASSDDSGDEYY